MPRAGCRSAGTASQFAAWGGGRGHQEDEEEGTVKRGAGVNHGFGLGKSR